MKTHTKRINSSYKGERFLRDLETVNMITIVLVLREALSRLGLQIRVQRFMARTWLPGFAIKSRISRTNQNLC